MDKCDDFCQRLIERYPSSSPRLTRFPSGAFNIELSVGNEVWVVEYIPKQGYGVSRQSTAVFGWEGCENVFENFDDAERFIIDLFK